MVLVVLIVLYCVVIVFGGGDVDVVVMLAPHVVFDVISDDGSGGSFVDCGSELFLHFCFFYC